MRSSTFVRDLGGACAAAVWLASTAVSCGPSTASGPTGAGQDASSGGQGSSSSGGAGSSGAAASSSGGASSGSSSSSGGSSSGAGTSSSGGGSSGSDGGSTGVPKFDHVSVIVMENESQTAIQGSADAPYINGLLGMYGYTSNYSTSFHPSLPNYLQLTSGSSQGVICDCQPTGSACTSACVILSNCGCNKAAMNLGDQLDAKSVQWREYGQSMGTPCNPTLAAPYAPKHIPFLYYDDIFTNTSRCQQRIRDYSDFSADLPAGTYRFSLISPNLCDDMHGDPSCPSSPSSISQGDTWLSMEIPKILAQPGFMAGGKDVLFIVWDEQSGSTGGASTPMLLIVISPLAKKGPVATAYTHASLLATIEDTFGVARLGDAVSVAPITDMWK